MPGCICHIPSIVKSPWSIIPCPLFQLSKVVICHLNSQINLHCQLGENRAKYLYLIDTKYFAMNKWNSVLDSSDYFKRYKWKETMSMTTFFCSSTYGPSSWKFKTCNTGKFDHWAKQNWWVYGKIRPRKLGVEVENLVSSRSITVKLSLPNNFFLITSKTNTILVKVVGNYNKI